MQKKFSYSVVKWTLLLGVASSLATACVVTSGDGTDISLGGDGNTGDTGNEGGEPASNGGTSAGKGGNASGGTSAGTGGSATAGTGGTGGSGGGAAAYVPGQCQADSPTPSMLPSKDPNAKDDACRKCMKTQCGTEWQTCFGDTPTTACGFGPKQGDGGQFQCILDCFFDNKAMETDANMLLADCTAGCALQCDGPDNGIVMDSTNELVSCSNDKCQSDCYPFN